MVRLGNRDGQSYTFFPGKKESVGKDQIVKRADVVTSEPLHRVSLHIE